MQAVQRVWTEKSYEPRFRDMILAPLSRRRRMRRKFACLGSLRQNVYLHLAYLPNHNVLFLKNSKAGCTTIAQILYYAASGEWYDGRIHIEQDVLCQSKTLWERDPKILERENCFRFTFVRNPEDRTISAFKDFVVQGRNRGLEAHREFFEAAGISLGESSERNFDAFLEYIEASLSENPLLTDRHWRSQVNNTGYNFVDYSFVGRVENMKVDVETVLDHLRLSESTRREIIEARFNRSGKADIQLTAPQRKKIRTLYASDYEAFSY